MLLEKILALPEPLTQAAKTFLDLCRQTEFRTPPASFHDLVYQVESGRPSRLNIARGWFQSILKRAPTAEEEDQVLAAWATDEDVLASFFAREDVTVCPHLAITGMPRPEKDTSTPLEILRSLPYRTMFARALYSNFLGRYPSPQEISAIIHCGWSLLDLRVYVLSSPEFYVALGLS